MDHAGTKTRPLKAATGFADRKRCVRYRASKVNGGARRQMSRLEKIEREIEGLEPADLARFRTWFARYDSANWDARIEADVQTGRLDSLGEQALSAHRAGRTRSL